ncbi:tandem-95 repeat protein [Hahella ganghwensis]|uniref:tandem-95 repeat protein n=1 Tax=Hahella ganghwensis TaxID=286420 RepID=UPI00036CD16D|nr:tandem-95 repeat protein [Hahella ganghwensis]
MERGSKKVNWAKELGKSLPAIALAAVGVQGNASIGSSRSRLQAKAWINSSQAHASPESSQSVFNGFSSLSSPTSIPVNSDVIDTSLTKSDDHPDLKNFLKQLKKKKKTRNSLLSGDTDAFQRDINPNFIGKTKASGTCSFTGLSSYCTSATSQVCTTDADCNFAGNNPPTDIGLDSTSINDSSTGAGAVIGNLSTTDADGGDTHTYALVSNGASGSGSCGAAGDDDNASFQVDNANDDLETGGSVSPGTYSVCIQTHDGTDSYQESFTITVNDATAPVFQNSTPSVGSISLTGATVSVDLDEEGTAYYVVVADGAGAPSSAQVKAGQDSGGGAPLASGSFATTATTGSEAFSGLSSGTAYDLYAVAEDDEGSPNLQASATLVNFTTNSPDSDGDLTASGAVTEPVGLDTTVDTVGEAVDVFDFTLSDGGTADGLAMTVSQIVVNVSGTSTDTERGNITWRLNGNDVSNVAGVYNAGSDTITFSGISISVADGGSETYTVNAYYNDNTGVTEDHTVILSVDGDTDLTVGGSGTSMGATSAVTNGTGTTLDVVTTTLVFTTQPSGSTSGSTLSTQPVVAARDAFGNTDVDFTEVVTLTESSAGTLSGDVDIFAVSGVATFTDVTYTATADQQSFTLTANDEDGTGSNLSTVDANSVTSDVVATKLVFSTQPSPLTVNSGQATAFSTVPVVSAQDANNVVDTGYSTDITLAEVNGAGSASMTGTGDTDGNGATVSITPSSGVSTFTGLSITYTASGGSSETFNLQASSGGLSTVNSSQLTGLVPDTDGDLVAAGGVSEPVTLNLTADTVGEAVDLFDFTISDGGTADGSALTVSSIVVNVSGTSSDTERGNITWRLNGSDASNVTGVYNAGSDTITFSGLSISVADGASETYTVNGYYNTTSGMTDGNTVILSVDGDTDLTLGSSGTQMGATSAVTNGSGTVINDDLPPSVSSVSLPSNATYVAGNNLDFTVNYDESVTVNTGGGTPRLALTIGATTRYASYLSGSGSSALVFRHTVVSGDEDSDGISLSTTLEPNSGTLQDAAGNDAGTDLGAIGSLASVLVDAISPTVAEVTPVTTPGNDSTPDITFSTDEAGTLAVGGSCGSGDEGAVSSGNNTITLTQTDNSAPLSAGTYSDCTITVTDSAGNASNVVTATSFTIDLTAPSGHSVSFDDSAINNAEASSIAFTFASAEVGAGYSYTISSSGGGTNVTGSGTISSGSDNITGIDVSGLGDGTLTLSVVLTDTAGNAAVATTDTATLDTTAPSGHSVSFDDSAIGDAEASSQSFTFAGGEVGADYSYTISSSGGGTNVTGSGTLGTATDQITGLNLSGLGDGTLTLSVVVTDTAGNAATAVTDTASLDTAAPTLSSSSPTDGATTVRFDANIVLNFSESVSAGSAGDLAIAVYKASDDSLVESNDSDSGQVSIVGSQVTVALVSDLDSSTAYYVQVGADAIEDTAGNSYGGIADTTTLNFTTTNLQATATNDSDTTNEDNAIAVSVLDNDSDEDGTLNAASVTVASGPSNGSTSVNTGTGVITYTPDADFNGSDSFTYTVEDNDSLASNAATVSITVNAVNDAPVAVADLATTAEDNAVSIDVAANDTDVDTGDAVDTSTITIVTNASDGSAVVNGGQVDYTPDANFNGTDTFTYTIEDGNSATSNTATVTINVTSVNDLPVASDDTSSVDEDNSVVIDVLTNDSDVDGTVDATTVTVQTNPSNGATSVNSTTGDITYTPDADFNGSDTFTYTVKDDADGTSNAATVTVTVNSINDAPVAADDTATLLEDVAHTINVLGNDSDVDGTLDASSVEVVTDVASGSTSVNTGTGAIVYTPDGDFNGSDSLTYRVQDNLGAWSDSATVTLTVQSVNDDPLANADSYTLNEDTPTVLDILSNDSDVDGTLDVNSISIVTDVSDGNLVDNGDGTLTYTPDANFNGADSFTYMVSDDEGSDSNTVTVSITVQAVNDAPTISGTPATTIVEGNAYSFTPTLNDVEGDTISVSASNLPSWLSLNSSTGALTGNATVVGTYSNIVLTATDGSASSSLAAFTINVQLDTDGDGDADVVDTDDDNDGMSDSYENANGLNPLDASDADTDLDGDTISNYQESLDGTDPNDEEDYVDTTAPVVVAPDELVLDAVALFTPVTQRQLLDLPTTATTAQVQSVMRVLASDNVDGNNCCNTAIPALINGSVLLPPGRNLVTYRAVDQKGNVGTAQQIVNIRPLVSVNKDEISVEGATVLFKVILNGQSPFYPLTVPYIIDSGSTTDSNDHDLVNGTVTFTKPGTIGQTEASISINLINDGVAESDEVLIVRLDDRTTNAQDLANGYDASNPNIYDVNSGVKTFHRITIVERNVAPEATLQLTQSGTGTIQVTRGGGSVRIRASVVDPNPGDSHRYNWSASDSVLVDTDGNLSNRDLVFDPSGLSDGRYMGQVTVTDSAGDTDTTRLFFRVVSQLPVLNAGDDTDGDGVNDVDEGTADGDDDGIPDYLDNITATNVIPEVASETSSYLVECDPGVRCRLGQFALVGNSGGVRLDDDDIEEQEDLISDRLFENVGGLFDFEIHDLPTLGQSVSIVLPQQAAIPASGIYRKFQNGEWMNFVTDENNTLSSAPGNPGYCPPPGDDSWEDGLVEGYYCVQLTIEDGGPNDADGLVNGSVEDPGGIGVDSRTDSTVNTRGGGGGAIHWLMLFAMFVVLGALNRTKLRHGATLSLLALALLLPAPQSLAELDEEKKYYLELGAYYAKGSQDSGSFTNGLESSDIDVSLNTYDVSRTAVQGVVGYRYYKNMAVEIGYLDLRDVDVDLDVVSPSDEELSQALENHYPVTGSGLTLANRIMWATEAGVTLSGEVGLFFWSGDIQLGGVDINPDLDGGADPLLGLGAGYHVTPEVEVVVRVKRLFLDHQKVDLLGVGGVFWF